MTEGPIFALQTLSRVVPKNAQRDALIEAYLHLENLAYALREALEAECEIEKGDDMYYRNKYAEMLGKAAVAMQKVPAVWLAILDVKLPEPLPPEDAA